MLRALAALLDKRIADIVALFWHTDFNHRRDRLLNLLILNEKKYEEVKTELDTLIKRLNLAYEMRNIAAHCTWRKGRKPDSISPVIIKFKGSYPKMAEQGLPVREYTAEILISEAKKIQRLSADFCAFFMANFGAEFATGEDDIFD